MIIGCGTLWLITRHPAARQWIEQQGLHIDQHLLHLDESAFKSLQPGDCVISNLPLAWIARLSERGIRYINLDLEIPPHLRGRELDLDTFTRCNPHLTEYHVERRKRWL